MSAMPHKITNVHVSVFQLKLAKKTSKWKVKRRLHRQISTWDFQSENEQPIN